MTFDEFELNQALRIEWLLWHYGMVVHPYLDHTILPLISFSDIGMQLQ